MVTSDLSTLASCFSSLESKEIREWIQLGFVTFGGWLAFSTFRQNLRQRRVENALKFIALFREGLKEGDMEEWEELYLSASEPAGAKAGEYVKKDGTKSSIGDFFAGGTTTSVARITQGLEVICHQANTGNADPRTIFYELGQLINYSYRWLSQIPNNSPNKMLLDAFPNIGKFIAKNKPNPKDWTCRIYVYSE